MKVVNACIKMLFTAGELSVSSSPTPSGTVPRFW